MLIRYCKQFFEVGSLDISWEILPKTFGKLQLRYYTDTTVIYKYNTDSILYTVIIHPAIPVRFNQFS